MRTTDKGLQKAIKRQPHYELPSNLPHDAKDTRGKYLTRKTAGKKNVHPLPCLRHTQRGRLHRIFYLEIRNNLHQLLAHL